jgi:hypothetical protein
VRPILIPVALLAPADKLDNIIKAEPVFTPAVTSTNEPHAHGYDAIPCWLFYFGVGDRDPDSWFIPEDLLSKVHFEM